MHLEIPMKDAVGVKVVHSQQKLSQPFAELLREIKGRTVGISCYLATVVDSKLKELRFFQIVSCSLPPQGNMLL